MDGGLEHDNAAEITLTLSRTSAKPGSAIETVEDAEVGWNGNTYSYSSLPMYDTEGYKYTYTVKEIPVSGYITTQDGYDFTNTMSEITNKISVSGTKTWSDVDDERSHDNQNDVILTLRRSSAQDPNNSVVVETQVSWTGNTYTYGNLDQYDADGYIYTYTVTEAPINGYTTTYDTENPNNITNTMITQPTAYRVEYYRDDILMTRDSYNRNGEAWINDNPAMIKIQSEINTSNDKYYGFKLSETQPEVPAVGDKVENQTIIRIDYVRDLDHTKNLQATIDHNVNGTVQEKDHDVLESTVWVLADNTLSTTGVVPSDKYTGYKFDHIEINGERVETLPSLVNHGDEIVFYYVPDKTVRKDLLATVDYNVGGSVKAEDHLDLTANVWINDPHVLSTSTVISRTYAGYSLDHIEITVAEETRTVDSLPAHVDDKAAIVYYYTENPDITIHYVVEEMGTDGDGKPIVYGSVSSSEETLAPATGIAEGSTAIPFPGYRFTKWTTTRVVDGKTKTVIVSTQAEYVPDKVDGENVPATYTAHFEPRGDLGYEVHYLYEDPENADRYIENEEIRVIEPEATFKTDIAYSTENFNFGGHTYTFEKTEGPVKVTAETKDNILNVYYLLDDIRETDKENPDPEGKDDKPDKYQITFTYVADEHGSVSGITSEVKTVQEVKRDETGAITSVGPRNDAYPTQPSTVKGDTGYHFSKWNDGTEDIANDDRLKEKGYKYDTVFRAFFEADDQKYTVRFIDEDTGKEIADSVEKDTTFGTIIKGVNEKADIKGYIFVRADDLTVGIDNSANIVRVYYSTDTRSDLNVNPNPTPENPGDGIPDKYQVTFTYQAEADAHGTVTGTTSEVKTIQEIQRDTEGTITYVGAETPASPTQPSTIGTETGYHFDRWTDEGGNEYRDDPALKATKFAVNKTFTAHFVPNAQTYIVQHVDKDTKRIIETSQPKATVFGAVINGVNEKQSLNGYAFVEADDLTVTVDNNSNIVRVYYSADTWSDPNADPKLDLDPENPGDGIPDKYQITFTYVARDNGTVTGTTTEVRTIQQIERNPVTGVITLKGEETPAHPTQPSTVKANEGYYFLQWNDGSENLVNDDAVRGKSYLKDTTFQAYFEATPNNLWEASKRVTNIPSRGYYRVGEDATFEITVRMKPGANRPLQDITLREQLAGAYFVEYANCGYTVDADTPGLARIDRLEPGQTVVLRAVYKVTRNDLLGSRKFQNIVRIEGKNDMSTVTPNEPDRKDVEVLEPGTGDIPAGRQNGGSGGSGGGGGGSSTRSPGTSGGTAGGPGTPTVTIDPEAVPLANLPDMGNDDILALIDDEDVPLAALPKTGQAGSAALMLMISSMMLAAFAVVTRKKEEEQ